MCPDPSPKLCECGCGEPAPISDRTEPARGYVRGEPMRFIYNHHARSSPHEFIEQGEMDCWVWQRSRDKEGYGKVAGGLAHRLYYQDLVGLIPAGLVIDHLCRNPSCVNPGHMEPVTDRENIMRSPIATAAVNARKTHCKRGHPFDEENTRYFKTPTGVGRYCRECQRLRHRSARGL